MKCKSNSDWSKLSIAAIIVAALLIIFSFLAPITFTQTTSRWNFTETGQIGDTIGGLMNPFIALGGVIMTFLAFYMQVRANKLQREQFLKSLNKDRVDEKIDCYYKLNLLKFDIEEIIKDIPERIEGLNTFIDDERKNPLTLNPLRRKPTQNYELVKEFQRLDIFKSFKYFLSDNKEWLQKFYNLFHLLDYLSKSWEMVYPIIDKHLVEVFGIKDEVRRMLIILEEESVKLFNENNTKGLHLDSSKLISAFLKNYREEIGKSKETDMAAILKIVSDFSDNVSVYFNEEPERYYYGELNDLSLLASKIAIKLNSIFPKSNQVIDEIGIFINKVGFDKPGEVYDKLKHVLKFINDGLSRLSIDDLQKEYDILPN